MRRRILARTLALALFLLGLSCSLIPWGRAALRTTFLIPAFIMSSQPAPLQIAGEPITHITQTINSRSGPAYLDLFVPTTQPLDAGTRQGVLLIPGAGDHRKLPELLNFAEAIARTGVVVMAMTTPTLIQSSISVDDTDAVVQAFQTLSRRPELRGQRSGIIAFSAGVPLACFGAADARIRDQVAFVVNFGGYFNTWTTLRAFGYRSLAFDGLKEPWEPIPFAVQVLGNMLIPTLASFEERETLREALLDGATPLSEQELQRLSPEARAIYRLLTGRSPHTVEADIAILPPETRQQIDALSPQRVLPELKAPVYLVHDRHDTALPFTESRDFAKALDKLHHPYDYLEVQIFNHVEVRPDFSTLQLLSDGSTLAFLLTKILHSGGL
ncbi:hypothetical protein EI42_02895 [Thermosporothrix hazakensis]|uniref:Alpha/beta hydrolase n=2 Tax=Thermosporothrix TaxID=768650 RepID=A0A326U9L8_THEHA|nr:hypothetical protein EI42_02895 [Thermosporothrix hazakensis]